jgi:hypothetical protein
MGRSLLLFIFLASRVTGGIFGQPCDCKWPVDVIILQAAPGTEKNERLAHLADSLRKSCRYLFIVSPTAQHADSLFVYTLLKAGKGNRIALLSAMRHRKDGAPVPASCRTAAGWDQVKERHRLIATYQERIDTDKLLEKRMPEFDFIMGAHAWDNFVGPPVGKTFLRLDQGKIIFIKEETIR